MGLKWPVGHVLANTSLLCVYKNAVTDARNQGTSPINAEAGSTAALVADKGIPIRGYVSSKHIT